MFIDQAAQRRRARSVSIVSHLPIYVQLKNTIALTGNDKATTVYLATATITITQLGNGEIAIEIEPP